MITLEQLRTQYKPQILELAKKHKVDNIRVFGSVARGDADEKSDIDLLCHLPEGSTVWEMAGMLYDLEELFKMEIDLVSDASLRPRVANTILSEAIPL
ncbi:MAG: nucleotidyltransferase family protein [Rickettsiales bacterium]